MAHLPVEGEEEHIYDMITGSPPSMEFGDYVPASANNSKPQRGHHAFGGGNLAQDFSQFLDQNQPFLAQKHPSSQTAEFVHGLHQELQYDPVMFANPNKNTKAESPDLLSPTTLGRGYRSSHSEFLSTHSVYLDAASNSNSLFHDAASHFSEAAEPPDVIFETNAQHVDTFNQEISLGESISSTNLAEMSLVGAHMYHEQMYPRGGYHSSDKFFDQQYQTNQMGAQMAEEITTQQDSWRYHFPQHSHSNGFPTYQQNYCDSSNKLTESNLINYNGKMEESDAKVTISIHQAPDIVAAHTPSLFSNSSHNSSSYNRQDYTSNQLQRPGKGHGRSQSQSMSVNSQSPSQAWLHSRSPSFPGNIASPSGSVYSDAETDNFLRPEDFHNIRRGRQSQHLQKVRSNSRSRSRSGSVLDSAVQDTYDSESDMDAGDSQEDLDAARSTREKMLELASSASVSKRTQIHPSSYACHLCEKKFTRPYNLKSHLRTHTDERPFICNICGKAFARQHDRKRHEELHSGEKKYQCRGLLRDGTPFGCGRKFARSDALRRHFQTESGKECIKQLVEEDAREQNTDTGALSSGIQLPDGEFMNPNAPEIPVVSVLPPQ